MLSFCGNRLSVLCVRNRLSVHDVVPLLSVRDVRQMSVPGVSTKLSERDVRTGCLCVMSVQRCRYQLSGLVSILLSNNTPIPRGIRCPAASVLPPTMLSYHFFRNFSKPEKMPSNLRRRNFCCFLRIPPDSSFFHTWSRCWGNQSITI